VNRVTEKENQIPSLYEWLGGAEVQNALMVKFYERVSADELLRPLFGDMPADHPRHVADFGRGAGRIASLHREPRRARDHAGASLRETYFGGAAAAAGKPAAGQRG
jgi:truncated hemoglobin YjbI